MGKLVSDRTAGEITTMLGRLGRSGIGRTLDPRDLYPLTDSSFPYKRFRVDINPDRLTVLVNAGIWWRNGTQDFPKIDTTVTGIGNDVDVDGYAASFVVGSYSVWLQFRADYDIDLSPTELIIGCGTLPDDVLNRNQIWLLASFDVVDVNGTPMIDAATLIRNWIGDIDDVVSVPDGESTSATPISTLDWQGDQNAWQMRNANAATTESGTAWEGIYGVPMMSKVLGSGSLVWVGFDRQDDGDINGTHWSLEVGPNDAMQVYGFANLPTNTIGWADLVNYGIMARDDVNNKVEYLDITYVASEITVITDIQYDATTHQLQYKSRTIQGIAPSDESAWTMWHQAEECEGGIEVAADDVRIDDDIRVSR